MGAHFLFGLCGGDRTMERGWDGAGVGRGVHQGRLPCTAADRAECPAALALCRIGKLAGAPVAVASSGGDLLDGADSIEDFYRLASLMESFWTCRISRLNWSATSIASP